MSPLMYSFVVGLVIVNVCLAITAYSIWFERKFAGRMQSRRGPTEVGWVGLLQPIADVVKLLQKEDTAPENADKALFNLAPPLTVLFAVAILGVVPFSAEHVVADLDVGILIIMAFGSILVQGGGPELWLEKLLVALFVSITTPVGNQLLVRGAVARRVADLPETEGRPIAQPVETLAESATEGGAG